MLTVNSTTPIEIARQLLNIIVSDHDRMKRVDMYIHGFHDDPYMPDRADEEYKLLARRAVSNWIPLIIGTPCQAMYVDGFRRANSAETEKDSKGQPRVTPTDQTAEWDHWQRSRLDARQLAIHRGALAYGHSFALTEMGPDGRTYTKGLSAMRTSAVFEDPGNDDVPYAALTITQYPKTDNKPGKALMWDSTYVYEVSFKSLHDLKKGLTVSAGPAHGAEECPVTRFTASVDLEGRTVGVVEPMIPLQNRINQTVFDLLVAQTYGSFQVRTVTGMVPPNQIDPETGDEILDAYGQPIPVPINFNARRFMFAEDHEAKFGSLQGTALGGYIESIDMSIRHLAAVSQTPPHYLLGQIANLSAEALQAAETALSRKVEEFKHSFGESWERVFRLSAQMEGNAASANDMHGEVVWRDMENKSLAQSADALGKMAEALGIPKRGLWKRVPNATEREIQEWEDLADQEPDVLLADALTRATPQSSTNTRTRGNLEPVVA
jgi:hypothetical protein